jgi:hypothetical protein
MNRKWLSGGMGLGLVICCALALAAVPGVFSHVQSATGYDVDSVTPTTGYALCGDGTHFDSACPIPGSAVLFYQTVIANVTSQPQEAALRFTPQFTLTDTGGVSTNVALNASGNANLVATVSGTPGASTAPAVFDGSGNITPSGTAVGLTCNVNGCYRIGSDGTIEEWGDASTSGSGDGGSFTLTFPHAFTTTSNLAVQFTADFCNLGSPSSCAGGGGGSNGAQANAAVQSPSVSAPTVAWWDTNTAASTISWTWRAIGH